MIKYILWVAFAAAVFEASDATSQATCADKPNEEFDPCWGGCPPKRCNIDDSVIRCPAPPTLGDKRCIAVCRCKDGFKRNANGTCVPQDQCPKCAEKPNEEFDPCWGGCPPKRCDIDDSVIRCAAPPTLGDERCIAGCRCKDGFKRNAKGTCIPQRHCRAFCYGENEVGSSCANGGCLKRCSQKGRPIFCVDPIADDCISGCLCKEGYLRDENTGFCVPEDKCPTQCNGKNEVFDKCISPCISRECGKEHPVVKCEAPQAGSPKCEVGCRCADGYKRSNGICIPENECPRCNGRNEVYNGCAPFCTPRNCSELDKDFSDCVSIAACEGRCVCDKGYYRDDASGTCVSFSDCPCTAGRSIKAPDGCNTCTCTPWRRGRYVCTLMLCLPAQCNGKNEVFDKCISPCISRECGKEYPVVKCEAPQAGSLNCEVGCRCADGYKRSNGICIPENECPRCNGRNEVYNGCAPFCTPRNCSELDKDFSDCVSIAACEGRCVCEKGYYRDDASGTCVSFSDCPCTAGRSIKSPDGCNTCTCTPWRRGRYICTLMLCLPAPVEDFAVSQAAAEA